MKRSRITITLQKEILDLIDNIIDNKEIRNRSNAIETVLSDYFSVGLKTAVILTSGRNTAANGQLRCLVDVKNKKIIDYTLELLDNYKIEKIIICSDNLQAIKGHLKKIKYNDKKIIYVSQKKNLGGTALALKLLKKRVSSTFLVIYGDVLVDINLDDFINFHNKTRGIVSMALTSVVNPKLWGMIKMSGNQITAFQEKPEAKEIESHLVNSGVFICETEIFDYIKKTGKSLEQDVLPLLSLENKLKGYVFDGQWYDTGEKNMYKKALVNWRGIKSD
jgi:NDP-sugar pyrophosphorylase family protein